MKNAINAVKNTVEGINTRLENAQEWINDLKTE